MNVPPDRIAFVCAGQVLAWDPRSRWLGMADLRMRVYPNVDVPGRPCPRERPSPGGDRGRPKSDMGRDVPAATVVVVTAPCLP
jgi:hypothetical protein